MAMEQADLEDKAVKKKACVTGANGYIASALISHLLRRGYAVNATVRRPGTNAELKRRLGAADGDDLRVFAADLDVPGSFDEAVAGCHYVFLVAAPVNLFSDDPEDDLIRPAVRGVLNVLASCARAAAGRPALRRVVLTSSAAAVSSRPLRQGLHVLDEGSWSDVEYLRTAKPPTWGYAVSKVEAEKAAAAFAEENGISIVTVLPVLTVGGGRSTSNALALALLSGDEGMTKGLKVMQRVSGSVSLVHVEDLCHAHIFLAEAADGAVGGRYICCGSNSSLPELATLLAARYPQYCHKLNLDDDDDDHKVPPEVRVVLSSEKLRKAGFEFKYGKIEEIYGEIVGLLNLPAH